MAQFLRTRYVMAPFAGGPNWLLTYYWDGTGGTDTALVTEAHARVRAFWNSISALILPATVLAFQYPDGDFIEETTGDIVSQATGTLPSAVTFTGTGDALPRQTQALMTLRTGTFISGRRVVGKQYIPGLAEGSNDSTGAVAAATRTSLATAANLLGTTIVTPMTQRVWHRPRPGVSGLSIPVSSRSIGTSWAVLRSRRS